MPVRTDYIVTAFCAAMDDRGDKTTALGHTLLDPVDRSSTTMKIVTTAKKCTAKDVNEGHHDDPSAIDPPDGGVRAWLVVGSAFLCNSILFGIINTFGIIYLTLQERMESAGDHDASSKAGKIKCYFW